MLKFSPNLGSVNVKTGWLKLADVEEVKFVGDTFIAVGRDSNFSFTNLLTAEESLYRAVESVTGEGISCFSGHKNLPLFAFAETTTQSRILVLTHPDSNVVSILSNTNKAVRYIHLSFSETEYLVALTGMPNYCLEIWHWRSKELLTSTPTDILTDKQTIGCSPTLPLTICQYAFYKGELNVWEVQGSANFCKLIQKPVALPLNEGKFDHTFSIDGVLYLVNRFGNVYQISTSTSSANLVVKWPSVGGQQYACSIEYLRSGLVVSEPNGELVYYKKFRNQWTQMWSVSVDNPFRMLNCLISKEFIIGVTRDSKLMKISADGDSLKITTVREFDVGYKCFVLVAPSKELLITLNNTNQIEVFDVKTGERISRISVQCTLLLESHPRHPYIAVGREDGAVHIVSLTVPKEPTIVAELFLSNVAIHKIGFSASGALMSVLDINGSVFLTRGWPDKRIYEIIHYSIEPIPPICLSITEMADDEKLFLLLASSRYGKLAADQIIGYKINESSHFKMKLPIFYSSLTSSRAPERTLFGVPFKNRTIHLLKITALKIEILQVIQTPNVVRCIEIYVDARNLLVWGTDGIVTLIDLDTKELIMTQTLHNRQSSGVKKAECSPCFRYIVTLGYSGNLVCTKVDYESFDPAFYEQQTQKISDSDIPPIVVPVSRQTYVDIVHEKSKLDEELAQKDEKQSLQTELADIKRQLVNHLDENEKANNDEMLPIQSFNVDVDGVAATLEHGRLEREEAKNCMLKFIENQKLVNQYILKMCWNSMDVKGTNLRGIFTSLKVENYAIPLCNTERDRRSCVPFLRSMEDLVGANDAFLPWKPIPINKLESVLSHEPEINDLNQDSKLEVAQKLLGTSTSKFIEPMKYRYDQLEVISFTQMHMENIMGNHDMMRLRLEFNKKFQKMAESKEYEMNLVCRGNQRLRHIQKELKILAQLRHSEFRLTDAINNPQYMPDEKPETIVKVEPNEVAVATYVSPSHQQLLDKQFAEMERKRLALLADDFKERALIYMMDGVLEHKWEDEIKKNPPKPDCLAREKKPEDYTAEDLVDIQRFEEETRALELERERYREILETEKTRLTTMSHEQIKKFNFKIGDLLLLKLQVEAAICQEEMKLLRFAAYNYQRIVYERKEQAIRREMELVQQQTNDLHAHLSDIQNKVIELRANYENLNSRDKLLEKQFKVNYADQCGSGIVDQAYKIFKKRPKFQVRAWATCPILLEMGKRIGSKNLKQSEILMPPESQELFQLLDQLDSYALSPSSIDSAQWQVLCKMRRFKIESEYKLRAYGLELAEAEATANAFIREIGNKKTTLINLEKKFHDVKSNKLKDSTNRTVQIVMKKGLIEIPLTGKFSDFEDSVLVQRSDIDEINKIIKKTGLLKLRTMQKGAVFRRKIIFREWEHKMLQMSVRDMKEFVNTVEKCKITKEVQLWLKYKEKGWEHDLGQAALNREIENAISNQEKQLIELQEKVKEIEHRILTEARKVMALDKEIQAVNVDVAERNLARNQALESKQTAEARQRMSMIVARAKMVRKVQQQHSQILELSTMLELQKLRTYPTLTTQPTLAGMKNAI